MTGKSYSAFALFIAIILLAMGCQQDDERKDIAWKNIEKGLQSAFITAKNGDTIRLDTGYFWFTRSLMMDGKSDIVIIGAGMEETILSFKGQSEGAEGIKISNCKNIQLIGFTVEDAKGDNIKVTDTNGILFSNVKTYWTNGAKESNGAYGFYPVLCKRVVIEDCVAARASDAGVYVGQSDSVIIRRNVAYENVAGIESENSNFVEIYDNHTYNNTGGILVFDLPGLTQYGHHTRVFNNKVISNNHKNFAPKGNIVGMVPPGTGIMLLATRKIEIFDNQITDNRTCPTAIISYDLVTEMSQEKKDNESSGQAVNHQYKLDSLYDPYPNHVFIHNNTYANAHWFPTMQSDFGKLFLTKFFMNTPDIIIDGFSDTKLPGGFEFCLDQKNASFANLNVPENLKNILSDPQPYLCKKGSVSETKFLIPGSYSSKNIR
jgi:parallel beta-helix repeat protein